MDQKELVIAVSVDADNCFFNKKYTEFFEKDARSLESDAVIRANLELLNSIVELCLSKSNEGYEVILKILSFSNRQSFLLDQHNGKHYKTESFFEALKKIHGYLLDKLKPLNVTVILEPYLLADSFDNLQAGDTFYGRNKQEGQHIFDESKLTIACAQAWKLLINHPNALIIYRCYDDDCFSKFVRSFQFLEKYSFWIHQRMKIEFLKYFRGEVTPLIDFQGKGQQVYYNYESMIKLMCYVSQGTSNIIDVCAGFEANLTAIKRFERFLREDVDIGALEIDLFFRRVSRSIKRFTIKQFLDENSADLQKDSSVFTRKILPMGDNIFHLVGLFLDNGDSVEFIKHCLKMGIDPNLEKNNDGEPPSDLLDDGKLTKAWLMLPTTKILPVNAQASIFPYWDQIKYKDFIQVKLAFHLTRSEGNHDLFKEIECLLNSEGDDFCEKLASLRNRKIEDPNCKALINLIDEWKNIKTEEASDTEPCNSSELSSEDEEGPPRKRPRLANQFSAIWAQESQSSDDNDTTNDEVMKDANDLVLKL